MTTTLSRIARQMTLLAALLGTFAVMACGTEAQGAGSPGERDNAGAPPGTAMDTALRTAIDAVQPTLESSYGDTFAGLQVDEGKQQLTIYRIPDPKLDAFVRANVGKVSIKLLDATYSLRQMKQQVATVTADLEFWKGKGIRVHGAMPQNDGSGVEVMVSTSSPAIEAEFRNRYQGMRLTLRVTDPIVPLTMGGV